MKVKVRYYAPIEKVIDVPKEWEFYFKKDEEEFTEKEWDIFLNKDFCNITDEYEEMETLDYWED